MLRRSFVSGGFCSDGASGSGGSADARAAFGPMPEEAAIGGGGGMPEPVPFRWPEAADGCGGGGGGGGVDQGSSAITDARSMSDGAEPAAQVVQSVQPNVADGGGGGGGVDASAATSC